MLAERRVTAPRGVSSPPFSAQSRVTGLRNWRAMQDTCRYRHHYPVGSCAGTLAPLQPTGDRAFLPPPPKASRTMCPSAPCLSEPQRPRLHRWSQCWRSAPPPEGPHPWAAGVSSPVRLATALYTHESQATLGCLRGQMGGRPSIGPHWRGEDQRPVRTPWEKGPGWACGVFGSLPDVWRFLAKSRRPLPPGTL